MDWAKCGAAIESKWFPYNQIVGVFPTETTRCRPIAEAGRPYPLIRHGPAFGSAGSLGPARILRTPPGTIDRSDGGRLLMIPGGKVDRSTDREVGHARGPIAGAGGPGRRRLRDEHGGHAVHPRAG